MAKIDVSYTAKADPQGRRLFKDTETGVCEWEVLPGEEKLTKTVTVDAELAKVAYGMTIEAEKKFEAESRPTKPVKRRKSHEGDK